MVIVRTLLAFIATLIGMLVAMPLLVIALPFWAVAFVTRRLALRLEPSVVSWQQLIEFHSVIGWKPKPHLHTYALADDVFQVTTDADGWRGQTTIADSDVVVFGDSHAFGHAIDDHGYFATLQSHVRVKAIGANGYNMVQELLWMRRLAPQLRNKLVVWFVFLGNDLLDNLEPGMRHYRTPFVRETAGSQGWEIVTEHVNPTPWPFVYLRYRQTNYDRLIKICTSTFAAQRAFSACGFLLAQGAEICKQAGAQLVVMTIPDPLTLSSQGLALLYTHGARPETLDPDLPDRHIRDMCEKLDLPFVAGTDHLQVEDYKKYDDHWNEKGHQRVADVLSSLYKKYACAATGEQLTISVPPPFEARQRV